MRLLFFYISHEFFTFSSLQLTPGGIFINNCEWRHQCHFSELHRTPPSQILDPPVILLCFRVLSMCVRQLVMFQVYMPIEPYLLFKYTFSYT